MSLLPAALFYLCLLLLLAVVSAMETATFAVRDSAEQISKLRPGSLRDDLQAILANPFLHLHRTLLVSAALNLALTALGLFLVLHPLRDLHINAWLSATVLFGVTVFIGDVVPKFIAVRRPAAVLLHTTRILRPLRNVLDPLALLAERVSDRLIRVFIPKHLKTRQPLTRDELETLIEMRQEQGILDGIESEILTEILEITELTVRDCMVPRVDLTLIEGSDPSNEIADELEKCRARFAVIHGETPDTVLGIVDVRMWKMSGRPAWRDVLQMPVFVPETFSALDALRQHLRTAAACVLILDEYGGLEGMVTQEELVDWLLYDAAPWQGDAVEVRELGGGRYMADGTARVDHIAEVLDTEIEPEGIDTIGGLVFNHLGYLPKQGERLKLQGLEIKVRRVSRRRIQQVELKLAAPPKPQFTEESEQTP
jgi:CBS domain containing-hemolysin-like protein